MSTCGPDLDGVARYSRECKKCIYLQHTKYLDMGHRFRSDPMYYLDPWNGGDDVRPKPQPKTPAYWQDVWGRVCDPLDPLQFDSCGMVFKSSLSTLEYWPKLKLNHLLDPMHIEGNIGKSLIKHLFGEKGVEWRKACVEQNMHPDLWSYKNDDGRIVLPSCPWILSKEEKRELIRRIGSYRMPTDYGANLRRAFGEYG